MIHESGSILYSKQIGAPMNYTKWEAFISRNGEKDIISGLGNIPIRVEEVLLGITSLALTGNSRLTG